MSPSHVLGLVVAILLMFPVLAYSETINVPGDYPTIQGAIDAAVAGDVVLVAPGTYVENLDFLGKAITVTSGQGAGVTIIDGNQSGSVVAFRSGEEWDSILDGFTLTNGTGSKVGLIICGGGVCCWQQSSPTIFNNYIYNNSVSQSGGGIACYHESAPTIVNNVIFQNTASHGGGVMSNTSAPQILNNTVFDNFADSKGGGICTYESSAQIDVVNTILWNNSSPLGAQVFTISGDDPTVSFSDIQGGWPGSGNIDADPMFVDFADGDPRISYGTVDMGADEFHPHLYTSGDATPGSNVTGFLIGLNPDSMSNLCVLEVR